MTATRIQAALRGTLLLDELTHNELLCITTEFGHLKRRGLSPQVLGIHVKGTKSLLLQIAQNSNISLDLKWLESQPDFITEPPKLQDNLSAEAVGDIRLLEGELEQTLEDGEIKVELSQEASEAAQQPSTDDLVEIEKIIIQSAVQVSDIVMAEKEIDDGWGAYVEELGFFSEDQIKDKDVYANVVSVDFKSEAQTQAVDTQTDIAFQSGSVVVEQEVVKKDSAAVSNGIATQVIVTDKARDTHAIRVTAGTFYPSTAGIFAQTLTHTSSNILPAKNTNNRSFKGPPVPRFNRDRQSSNSSVGQNGDCRFPTNYPDSGSGWELNDTREIKTDIEVPRIVAANVTLSPPVGAFKPSSTYKSHSVNEEEETWGGADAWGSEIDQQEEKNNNEWRALEEDPWGAEENVDYNGQATASVVGVGTSNSLNIAVDQDEDWPFDSTGWNEEEKAQILGSEQDDWSAEVADAWGEEEQHGSLEWGDGEGWGDQQTQEKVPMENEHTFVDASRIKRIEDNAWGSFDVASAWGSLSNTSNGYKIADIKTTVQELQQDKLLQALDHKTQSFSRPVQPQGECRVPPGFQNGDGQHFMQQDSVQLMQPQDSTEEYSRVKILPVPAGIKVQHLHKLFSRYGMVLFANINAQDMIVEFVEAEDARKAYDAMQNGVLFGTVVTLSLC